MLLTLTLAYAQGGQRPSVDLGDGQALNVTFRVSRSGLQGVRVAIGTFARVPVGTLSLRLRDPDGTELAGVSVAAGDLLDLQVLDVPCDPVLASHDRPFVLQAIMHGSSAGHGVALLPLCDGLVELHYLGEPLQLGEVLALRRVVQRVEADADGLSSVRVLFTDYGRENRGSVTLVLRDPLHAVEVARVVIEAAGVGNEDWRTLSFAPIADSSGRSFAIELTSSDGVAGSALTVYGDKGGSYRGGLTVDGRARIGRMALQLEYAVGSDWLVWLGSLLLALTGMAGVRADWQRRRRRDRQARLALMISFLAGGSWMAGFGYLNNLGVLFYVGGIAVAAGIAGFMPLVIRRRRLIGQVALGTSALFVGLGVMEWGQRMFDSPVHAAEVEVEAAYSFDAAKGNPEAFRRFWQKLTGAWHQDGGGVSQLVGPDPLGELPFVVRPNTATGFFESTIAINSLGLRGPEVARDKGAAIRVLCLGESTTMGQTINHDDRPWPEVLQDLLNSSQPGVSARRVQVLNAGFAGYDLRHTLIRLRRDLLDLKPDLLVVYHGFNGFWMLDGSLPSVLASSRSVPALQSRPSRLLAGVEYSWALSQWKSSRESDAVAGDASDSLLASAYQELIELAREHGVALALCSFHMAVDGDTSAEVVDFYRAGFPNVERVVVANRMQHALLAGLAGEHDHVTHLSAAPDLQGDYRSSYVDLVHFTQRGRDLLAAHIAAGIRSLLPR